MKKLSCDAAKPQNSDVGSILITDETKSNLKITV